MFPILRCQWPSSYDPAKVQTYIQLITCFKTWSLTLFPFPFENGSLYVCKTGSDLCKNTSSCSCWQWWCFQALTQESWIQKHKDTVKSEFLPVMHPNLQAFVDINGFIFFFVKVVEIIGGKNVQQPKFLCSSTGQMISMSVLSNSKTQSSSPAPFLPCMRSDIFMVSCKGMYDDGSRIWA